MSEAPAAAWRVFPWDPGAEPGEPFSASWVPPSQGQGRFDLPATPGGVLYLAESPVHAVAERIQHFRGQVLDEADLRVAGHPLALGRVEIPERLFAKLADLCDPTVLIRLGIRPDATASGSRRTTQQLAAAIHSVGYRGLRWWSALRGDWHTLVLFRDKLTSPLSFESPEPLSLSHEAVQAAMRELGMRAAPQR